jgi:RNA polymerase sigma-70 factor (ECF subfamily)
VDELDYEQIVAAYHEPLYRFAFSLAGNPDDAGELTQETYVRLLTKGRQLRDRSKVKTWLFTTLYRIFLGWRRHTNRFTHVEICSAEDELPPMTPEMADEVDSQTVMEAVLEIGEHYRAPLALYYLRGFNYREVAEVLDVPIGTVMSRLSRGKELIRQRLTARLTKAENKILPVSQNRPSQSK